MDRPNKIRDQLREMQYLQDEEKVLNDMMRKAVDQLNRLKVEEANLRHLKRTIGNKYNASNTCIPKSNVIAGTSSAISDPVMTQMTDIEQVLSSQPSRADLASSEVSSSSTSHFNQPHQLHRPNVITEPIDLDVSQVLLRLSYGGIKNERQFDEEFEEEEDED